LIDASVTHALEIVDYRTEVPRAITNTIAENAAYGAIVSGGSVTRPVDIESGDVIHADYGPLGAIGVSFA